MSNSDLDPDWLATLERFRSREDEQRKAEAGNPHLREQREAAERSRMQQAIVDTLRDAGAPANLIRILAAGTVRETQANAKVRAWYPLASWCLVLGGSFGIGKSMAAALWLWLMAKESAEAKRSSPHRGTECWLSAAKFARLDLSKGGAAAIDAYARMPVLVLDDLGAEHLGQSGWFLSQLGDLLNERQANSRRTLITTNLSGDAFKIRYEERIAERIRDGGMFTIVKGENLREGNQLMLDGMDAPKPEVSPLHLTRMPPHTARYVARSSAYRIRMPKARAVRNRNQLTFLFA